MSGAPQGQRAPRVLVGVSGCIAAYKACEVVRGLQKAGCEVRVAMSPHATQFVGAATFDALTGAPTLTDLFAYPGSAIPHIELSDWADLALVVPATANLLAKMAHGLADDALSSTLLACACSVLVAPAMNTRMWRNPATQANLRTLRERGVRVVEPEAGRLACGEVGEGKLAAVDDVVQAALDALAPAPQPLRGKRVVITAGPTHEAIDPVRFIANASSGKMGYALARAARDAGAQVTLVSGPVALAEPAGVQVLHVVSAAQMYQAARDAFAQADAAICAAAVADYTPAAPADHKLKKGKEELDVIRLVRTTDILASLSAAKGARVVVGFAAETDDLIAHATEKLARKGCDMIVANDVSRPDSTFGSETDAVTLLTAQGARELPCLPKDEVARQVVAELARLLGA